MRKSATSSTASRFPTSATRSSRPRSGQRYSIDGSDLRLASGEYGDKTSLVVNATTRSGLGQKPTGSFLASYGSFGSIGEESDARLGGPRFGSFLVFNGRADRPVSRYAEFRPIQDIETPGLSSIRHDRARRRECVPPEPHGGAQAGCRFPTPTSTAQDQKQRGRFLQPGAGISTHSRRADSPRRQPVFSAATGWTTIPSRNPFDDSPANPGGSAGSTH